MKRSLAVLVAAFFAVTAVAAAAVAGTYSGKTIREREPITVTLVTGAMSHAHYFALYTCRKGGSVVARNVSVSTDLPRTPFSAPGKINARYSLLHNTDHIHFVASINRRGHLVGWFNETYTSQTNATCHSGTVYFNLAHQ